MRLIFFGAPGSGKGTHVELFSKYFGIKKISLGDLLRDESKAETPLGLKLNSYMDNGLLAPDDLVSEIIKSKLKSDGFVLDGYPRTIAQAKMLDEMLQEKGIDIDAFIYLKVDDETVIGRLTKRLVCENCSAIYHLVNNPPREAGVCDLCRMRLKQRKDDSPEVIRKRLEVFSAQSKQVLDFYKDKQKLVCVDGRGQKDDVAKRIKKAILPVDSSSRLPDSCA
ncbi:MAG: adenylate kinase [Candidatus Omnitrophota bacterium]